MNDESIPAARQAVLAMSPEQFRDIGHSLVDTLAEFFAQLPTRPLTSNDTATQLRALLPEGAIPEHGVPAEQLMSDATRLLMDHSLFNAHPRFFGYITAGPAPMGVLAEMLAAAINANVGGATLAPIASAIEEQTVHWIAGLMGYPVDCGGLLVSGGNMANIVAFFAARRAHANWNLGQHGVGKGPPLLVYASAETHTWLHKAADMSGIGTDAIRWVPTDNDGRMDTTGLAVRIDADRQAGGQPFLLIGTAGTVATGAVDPLPELARIAREQRLWFHVDGAYGGIAASLLDTQESSLVPSELVGLREADSIALDPHKWLYAPLEAGCVLVRRAGDLRDAFSYKPSYYHFDDDAEEPLPNYYEYGPQNSRGFRALKVWLQLRQAGRAGYRQMMSDDIRLAHQLQSRVRDSSVLQPGPGGLSIATFRYVPQAGPQDDKPDEWLDALNTELLDRLQRGGEAFVSNAVINGCFWLRACIVNFRTQASDIDALVELVERIGGEIIAGRRIHTAREVEGS